MNSTKNPRALFTLIRTKAGKTPEAIAFDALGYNTIHILHIRNWRSRQDETNLPPDGHVGTATIHDEEWLCACVDGKRTDLNTYSDNDLDNLRDAIGEGFYRVVLSS